MLPGAIAYTYLGFAGREAVSGGDNLINTILIAIALLAVAMFLPRFVATMRRGPGIEVGELRDCLSENKTLVLDVRTEKEFESDGHIDSALNIPIEKLEQELSKLEAYLEKSISIICRTDKRSIKAANVLLKHGYQDVRVVKGGMIEWLKR
jgi:rhodanese-related sulfurtransferase